MRTAIITCTIFVLSILKPVASLPPIVYFIRHAEKLPNHQKDWKQQGGLNDHGLERAKCLAQAFTQDSRFGEIGLILAPDFGRSGSNIASTQTVKPLADELGLLVDSYCGQLPTCVQGKIDYFKGTGNVLVVWDIDMLHGIAQELGVNHAPRYPEDSYNIIWTIDPVMHKVTNIQTYCCPGFDDC